MSKTITVPEFVALLRSGDYLQGQNYLAQPVQAPDDSSFWRKHKRPTKIADQYWAMCCLGVAEHACGANVPDLDDLPMQLMQEMRVTLSKGSRLSYYHSQHPDEGVGYFDIEIPFYFVHTDDDVWRAVEEPPYKYSRKIRLSELNDRGFTFDQIADLLEHFDREVENAE